MMKRYYNIKRVAAMAMSLLLLAACTKSDGAKEIEPPVGGEASQLGVSVMVESQSRSVVLGEAFAHGNRIAVLLHDATATTIYQGVSMPYEFKKLTDEAGVWVPTEDVGLMVQGDIADVLTHHPAILPQSATLSTDKKSLNVALPATLDFGTLNTSSAFEQFFMTLKAGEEASEIFICNADDDFMVGKGTQVSTAAGQSKQTTIAMKHSMAMVIVYVKRNASLPDKPDVRSIAIRNKADGAKPLKQGSFALSDNTFTPNATEASYTRTMSGFPIDLVRYAMMVYPATMEAGAAEMVLTTDGASYTMPMPAKSWSSGKVYIYNVEISANTAQIGATFLTDWPEWIEKPLELE